MASFTPIPNYVGPTAGQSFRQAINNALGGSVPITPQIVGGTISGVTINVTTPPAGDASTKVPNTTWVAGNTVTKWNGRQGSVVLTASDVQQALQTQPGSQSIGTYGYNAVGDCQKYVMLVSQSVGSAVMTVAAPPIWVAVTGYAVGNVVSHGRFVYSCVIAGTSSAGTPPVGASDNGGVIMDGTVGWTYVGPTPPSANIFVAGDVGKIISVIPVGVFSGFNPWWHWTGIYAGHTTIAGFNSASSINTGNNGSSAPAGPPAYGAQTWPWASIPALVMWGTDNSAAIQSALNSCQASGGSVFIPAGNFAFGTQLQIYSKTKLYGFGDASQLVPLGVHDAAPQSQNVPALVNQAWVSQSAYRLGSNGAFSLYGVRATFGDHDITLSDFTFDMSASGAAFGDETIGLFLAFHSTVSNLKIFGQGVGSPTGIWMIGCDDVKVANNLFLECTDAVLAALGCSRLTIADNVINVPFNAAPVENQGVGGYYGVFLQAAAGFGLDFVASDIRVERNRFNLNGAVNSAYATNGIMVSPQLTDSAILNLSIEDNNIVCANNYNNPIQLFGGIVGAQVAYNTIKTADGVASPPVIVSALAVTPTQAISNVSCASGSNIITVTWPNHGFSGASLATVPGTSLFFGLAGPTIGGISLIGFFPVVSVVDANNFTVSAFSNANATVPTHSWSNVAVIYQVPIGIDVQNNVFIDCTSNTALISIEAIAARVDFNTSVLSSNANNGSYFGIVNFYTLNNQDPGEAIGNGGVPGQGSVPVGYTGNNRVYWYSTAISPTPVVMDFIGAQSVHAASVTTNASIATTRGSTNVTNATATTLTAAGLLGAAIFRTGPTSGVSDVTDSAANIVAALPNCQIGSTTIVRLVNQSTGLDTITAGSGVTLTGTMTVAAGTWRDLSVVVGALSPAAVTITNLGAGSV